MNNVVPSSIYLSVRDVADRFGVSVDSIWRWTREGNFPAAIKLGGRTTRWRLQDILDWEASCSTAYATGLDLPSGWSLAG